VQDTDYSVIGTVAVALSRTSGESTTITLTSAAAPSSRTCSCGRFKLQSTTVVVTVEDQPSIAKYGRKSLQDVRLPVWANQYDAEAILDLIVAKRAERLPTVTVTMRGAANPYRLAECLGGTCPTACTSPTP
jgi:hypothetical protein